MPFTTSMQDHSINLIPLHTIQGGGIIQSFPLKPQILLLNIPLKVILILLVSNIEPLLNTNLYYLLHKNPIWKFDGNVHPNSNQNQ